jgi:hypothetical protein
MVLNLNKGLQQNIEAWNCKIIRVIRHKTKLPAYNDLTMTSSVPVVLCVQELSWWDLARQEKNARKWRRKKRKTETPEMLRPSSSCKKVIVLWVARLVWMDGWMKGWLLDGLFGPKGQGHRDSAMVVLWMVSMVVLSRCVG